MKICVLGLLLLVVGCSVDRRGNGPSVQLETRQKNHLLVLQGQPGAGEYGNLWNYDLTRGEGRKASVPVNQNSWFRLSANTLFVVNRFDWDNLQLFSFPSLE